MIQYQAIRYITEKAFVQTCCIYLKGVIDQGATLKGVNFNENLESLEALFTFVLSRVMCNSQDRLF